MYLRVSTLDQTTANQERELRQARSHLQCPPLSWLSGARPRGPLTMTERHARLAFAAECARHKDAVVEFWFKTMMDSKADMSHRIACSDRLMNRAFGLPMQISSETINENRTEPQEYVGRRHAPQPCPGAQRAYG
jgi:hypothetical protein